MSGDLLQRVARYHAALNAGDLATVESMFAENAAYRSPSVGAIAGRAAIMAAMRAYFAEYPDQVATDDSLEPAGDNAVHCQWRLRATARSTGRPYLREGAETIAFDADGRIVSIDVFDR